MAILFQVGMSGMRKQPADALKDETKSTPAVKAQIESQRAAILQNPSLIGQTAGAEKPVDPANCLKVGRRVVNGNTEYYSTGYVLNEKPLGVCSNLLLLDLSGTMGPNMERLQKFIGDLSKDMKGGAMVGLSGCETITDADLKKFNSEFAGKAKLERPSGNQDGILVLSVNDVRKDLSRGMGRLIEYKGDDAPVEGHKEINRGSTRLYEAMALTMVKFSQEYAKIAGIGKDAIENIRKNGKDFPFVADNLGDFPYTKYATYKKNGQEYFLVMYNDSVSGSKVGALPKNAVTAKWLTDALGYSPDIDKDTRETPTQANAPKEYAYYQVLMTLKGEAGVGNKIQMLAPKQGDKFESGFFDQMQGLNSAPLDKQGVNWFTAEPAVSNPKVVFPTNQEAKEFEADQKLPEGQRKWRKAGEVVFQTYKEHEEEVTSHERKTPVGIVLPTVGLGSITSIFKSMRIGNGGEVCDAYRGAGGSLISETKSVLNIGSSWVTLWEKKDRSKVTEAENGSVAIELKGEADWYGGVAARNSPHYDPRTNIRDLMKCSGYLYNEAIRQGKIEGTPDKTLGEMPKSRMAIGNISVDQKTGEIGGNVTMDGVQMKVNCAYDEKAGTYSMTVPVQKGIDLELEFDKSRSFSSEKTKCSLVVSKDVINASQMDEITFNASGLKYVYAKGEKKADVYNLSYMKKPEHEVTTAEFDKKQMPGVVAPYSGPEGSRYGDGSKQNNAPVIDLRDPENVKISVVEEKK